MPFVGGNSNLSHIKEAFVKDVFTSVHYKNDWWAPNDQVLVDIFEYVELN